MNKFPLIFSLLTLNLLFSQHLLASNELCSPFSCNQHRYDPIQFPFWVPKNQTSRCGYPGFDVSCNSYGQTLIPLNSGHGHLIIEGMSYPDQLLWVSDPKKCIPKRVLDFTHTWPALLRFGPLESTYTYLNCSGTKLDPSVLPMGTSVISCMSGSNHTVVAAFDHEAETKMLERGGERKCEVIERVNAAFWWPEMRYGYEYRHGDEYRHGYYPIDDLSNVFVQLGWDIPSCGDCILRGGSCGLVGDSGIEVACYIPASSSSERMERRWK
ncbi:putative RING-H2 finger protein ATL21A [Spinacia oleracea]|uniref:RING-type E3 ubiquitin transferase n=1 Tax=Spinacia oleracea TaxID=3562 RepID=A0ABM3R210_SPIOL|nr:putative RING-H2 finger protein ATL21A [Spinacia oleracea]